MHPILFNAGPVTIYSYGVLLASAYLLGLWLAVRRARNEKRQLRRGPFRDAVVFECDAPHDIVRCASGRDRRRQPILSGAVVRGDERVELGEVRVDLSRYIGHDDRR